MEDYDKRKANTANIFYRGQAVREVNIVRRGLFLACWRNCIDNK